MTKLRDYIRANLRRWAAFTAAYYAGLIVFALHSWWLGLLAVIVGYAAFDLILGHQPARGHDQYLALSYSIETNMPLKDTTIDLIAEAIEKGEASHATG